MNIRVYLSENLIFVGSRCLKIFQFAAAGRDAVIQLLESNFGSALVRQEPVIFAQGADGFTVFAIQANVPY